MFADGRRTYRAAVEPYEVSGEREVLVFLTDASEAAEMLGNGSGVVHGGAFMAFADHLGAVGTIANLPNGASTATIESKTNFFAPGKIGGILHAESVPLHRGKRTNVWQTRITDDDGRLLAQVTQTQIVLPPEPKSAESARGDSH